MWPPRSAQSTIQLYEAILSNTSNGPLYNVHWQFLTRNLDNKSSIVLLYGYLCPIYDTEKIYMIKCDVSKFFSRSNLQVQVCWKKNKVQGHPVFIFTLNTTWWSFGDEILCEGVLWWPILVSPPPPPDTHPVEGYPSYSTRCWNKWQESVHRPESSAIGIHSVL